MSTANNYWKTAFHDWPDQIPKRGVITNVHGEGFPFKGFMLGDEMLLLERTNPDTVGTRFIMLPYDTISSIKFVDPLNGKTFEAFGFVGKLSV